MCMKYKHLDSVDYLVWLFCFVCLQKAEKMNGIYLGIAGKGRLCEQGLQCLHHNLPPSDFNVKHFDVWHISADMASNKYNLQQMFS